QTYKHTCTHRHTHTHRNVMYRQRFVTWDCLAALSVDVYLLCANTQIHTCACTHTNTHTHTHSLCLSSNLIDLHLSVFLFFHTHFRTNMLMRWPLHHTHK